MISLLSALDVFLDGRIQHLTAPGEAGGASPVSSEIPSGTLHGPSMTVHTQQVWRLRWLAVGAGVLMTIFATVVLVSVLVGWWASQSPEGPLPESTVKPEQVVPKTDSSTETLLTPTEPKADTPALDVEPETNEATTKPTPIEAKTAKEPTPIKKPKKKKQPVITSDPEPSTESTGSDTPEPAPKADEPTPEPAKDDWGQSSDLRDPWAD